MTTIQRDRLHAFVDRELDRIAATPVPPDMAALGALERLAADEIASLWAAAGIASRIGLALVADPGRFVEPWPAPDEEPERLAV